MRVLLVSRYKNNFKNHILPFVYEQGDALQKCGVEVDYFLIEGKGILSYFKSVKPLKKKIKEFAPDIIHAHYGLSGITAVLQRDVPVVTTFHNGETLGFKQNILSSVASLFNKYTIYVAQHIYDKSYFKRKKNYTIMPCGVTLEDLPVLDYKSTREKLGFKSDTKYILFGGAFSNLRKNYPLLKSAVELIKDVKINVIEMNGLSRMQTTELMYACDVFALPSKSEGSPQALKEAMACNCPIVATDIADIKYLLGDVNGNFICTFEAEDVAYKIRKAIEFNNRTNGRERILELGLTNEQVAEKLIKIYKQIIK